MTTETAERPQVLIPLSQLDPSPTNPRTGRGSKESFAELVRTVRQFGIMQPPIVRAVGGRYEVVFGNRRLLAAREVGLDAIVCIVASMTDEQVLEAQLVENAAREDMHPLDEADAYRRLHDEFKHDADEIAALIAKSKSHVYTRLKLCDLSRAAAKACRVGTISVSVAEKIARIPHVDQQDEALEEIVRLTELNGGEPLPARKAFDLIRQRYHMRLLDAPFNVTDSDLVAGCPACADCPKRTGSQPKLWPDVDDADTCTDVVCFRGKADAAWKAKAEAAKAEGTRLLSAADTKRVFASGSTVGNGWIDLSSKCRDEGKTWRRVLGKAADEKEALCRDPLGRAVYVIEVEDAYAIAREAGFAWAKKDTGSSGPASSKEDRAKERAKAAREEAIDVECIARASAVAGLGTLGAVAPEACDVILTMFDAGEFYVDPVAERLGLDMVNADESIRRHARKVEPMALASLAVEVSLHSILTEHGPPNLIRKAFEDAIGRFGVDRKAVAKEVRELEKEAAEGGGEEPRKRKVKP